MDFTYIIQRSLESLLYEQNSPMLFNSGVFLFSFTAFLFFYALLTHKVRARTLYVIAYSLFFYYKSSGVYVLNLALAIVFNYYWARYMHAQTEAKKKYAMLSLAVVFNAGFLLYFKYTHFILDNFRFLIQADFDKLDIFLPIGISFYTFQTISYLVDVYRGTIKPCDTLEDFAFYLSFFPQLVAGPIVRAKDFLPQIHQRLSFSSEEMGEGLFMILKGLVKKAIIADYISQYANIVYANPSGYSGLENLMAMYTYTLQIYCDFSGYSDMAIGLALVMGFKLPENFRSPYNSMDITEFWRRWHISLSTWLRDYIYIPLGGNRYGEERQFLYLMLTMLIGGLWHGADWKFVFWGGMHGLGLIVHKVVSQTVKQMEWNPKPLQPISWLLTFHFVAFLWVYFRAESFTVAAQSINRIVFNLDWAYLYPFVQAQGLLCVILVLGYAIHFVAEADKERMSQYFATLPTPAKALALLLVIQVVLQVQSENVKPFIYFQF